MTIVENTFGVAGMTCDGCERSVARALAQLEGVAESRPNHAAGTVLVRFDADRVGPEAIGKAIEDAGYVMIEGEAPLPGEKIIYEIGLKRPNHP